MGSAICRNVAEYVLMGCIVWGGGWWHSALGDAVAGSALPSPSAAATSMVPLPSEGVWDKKMRELYKTLASLLTDVTSDKRFKDPVNRRHIEGDASRLAALVHDLDQRSVRVPDADPTLRILVGMLGRETKRAVVELRRGNRDYARSILRTVPSYCIACHTRNPSGPQFTKLPFEPTQNSLTDLEQGEFFAASRQFDRAQDVFKKIILNVKQADVNHWDWSKAVHYALAIAVRVKKDPSQAIEIVQAVLDSPQAPLFMRENARSWKKSIVEWQTEPPHRANTEAGLRTEAMQLMARAREIQKYPMDRTADIVYLRASAAAHDLLQASGGGMYLGDALFLAGLSYEVLSPIQMEDLHDVYYEACIRQVPHTEMAELCYRRYEESMFSGYTGSLGTEIPGDIRKKSRELQRLAQPIANINPPQ